MKMGCKFQQWYKLSGAVTNESRCAKKVGLFADQAIKAAIVRTKHISLGRRGAGV